MATTFAKVDLKSLDGNSKLLLRFDATLDNSDLGPNDVDVGAMGIPLGVNYLRFYREGHTTLSTDVVTEAFSYAPATGLLTLTHLAENSGTAANGIIRYAFEVQGTAPGSMASPPLSIS